ncbi:hypothetical protein N8314_03815 [Akkermansiaceae bacterium]|nr:hypothetical protein [Akkermansiaceae bacterium]
MNKGAGHRPYTLASAHYGLTLSQGQHLAYEKKLKKAPMHHLDALSREFIQLDIASRRLS